LILVAPPFIFMKSSKTSDPNPISVYLDLTRPRQIQAPPRMTQLTGARRIEIVWASLRRASPDPNTAKGPETPAAAAVVEATTPGPVTVVVATAVVTTVVAAVVIVCPPAVAVTVPVTVAEVAADDCVTKVGLEVTLFMVVAVVDWLSVPLVEISDEMELDDCGDELDADTVVAWQKHPAESDCPAEPTNPQPASAEVTMANVSREAKATLNLLNNRTK
jgi:hypothetical protein